MLVHARSRSFTPDPGRADPVDVLRLIHERLAELARRGYRHHPVAGDVRDDQRTARALSCPECLHRGLHFTALSHPKRPGHISLAWCDACRVAIDVPQEADAGSRYARTRAARTATRPQV